MACDDGTMKIWTGIKEGAKYSLSVTGPAGGEFTAFAKFFEDSNAGAPDIWQDICPGPHVEALHAEHVHVVQIHVLIVSATPIDVKVEAKVEGKADFCQIVTGAHGATALITHVLGMA